MHTPLITLAPLDERAGYTEGDSIQQMKFAGVLATVIGMISEDGQSAIDLLGQHRSHEKVWPGLRTERKAPPRLDGGAWIETIWSANEKNEIARTSVTHRAQHLRKGFARHPFAARIKRNDVSAERDARR